MDPSGKGPIGGVWGTEGRQELNWANSPLHQSRPIRFVTVRDWLHITVHHVAVSKGMWYHPTLRCFVQHVGHNTTNWRFLSKHLIAECYLGAIIKFLSFLIFAPQKRRYAWYICTYECTKGGRDANKLYWVFHSKSWESCRQMLMLTWCWYFNSVRESLSLSAYTTGWGNFCTCDFWDKFHFIYIYIVFPPHIVHKERPLLLCLSFFRPSSLYNTINCCYCNTPRAARLQRLLPAGLLPRVFPELKGDGWLWNSKTDWGRCLFEVGKMD